MSERHLSIGIDLGGTKIEAAVLARAPEAPVEVLLRRRVSTPRDEGYEAVLGATAALIADTAREVGLDVATARIGVGMPGGVARATGLVKNSNTVCLNGRPFRADLAARLRASITFDNDANCFALAEATLGAARPYADGVVFGVILGTGVGGGLVVRGKVWSGAQGIAGEWGHHDAGLGRDRPCYCGQRGCIETHASGPAVEASYFRRTGERLGLAAIDARRPTDPHARAAIEELIEAFGRGLANVVDIVDPSVVVLGGGVSNLEILYGEGVARVASYVFNDELSTPVVRHALGDSAGVLGAALLVS